MKYSYFENNRLDRLFIKPIVLIYTTISLKLSLKLF